MSNNGNRKVKLVKRAILTRRQNEHGNIAIWEHKDKDGKILHASTKWLNEKNLPSDRLTVTCKAHGIDYRLCFVEMKSSGGWSHKVHDGIYIAPIDQERLQTALEERKAYSIKSVVYRDRQDDKLAEQWKHELQSRFPNMPKQDADDIAFFATFRGSGRVGRSHTAEDPIKAAVIAHIRHNHTSYDSLLESGYDRESARHEVGGEIASVYRSWKNFSNEGVSLSSSTAAEQSMAEHYKAVDDTKPPHAPPSPATTPGPVEQIDWDYLKEDK